MKFLSKKSINHYFVASIDSTTCRFHLFVQKKNSLIHQNAFEFQYSDFSELENSLTKWIKKSQIKDYPCCWILRRELYQTYQIDPPNVLEKELNEAIKWQIKDLIDQPVNEVLINHYRLGQDEEESLQITAVCANKALVENLIEISQRSGLKMNAIEIEELSIGSALLPYLEHDKIAGYIGQDKNGLIFNFYNRNTLYFTRHIKGRFLPVKDSKEFSLDSEYEDQEELFLLETQRTIDYVVSQIFRQPIDSLLIQQLSSSDESIAEILQQLTEVKVTLFSPEFTPASEDLIVPNLFEVGSAIRGGG